jgi:hypothetical protein
MQVTLNLASLLVHFRNYYTTSLIIDLVLHKIWSLPLPDAPKVSIGAYGRVVSRIVDIARGVSDVSPSASTVPRVLMIHGAAIWEKAESPHSFAGSLKHIAAPHS